MSLVLLAFAVIAAGAAIAALIMVVRQARTLACPARAWPINRWPARARKPKPPAPPCAPPTPAPPNASWACAAHFETAMEQMRTVLSREQGELRLALAEAQRKSAEQIGTQFEATRTMMEAKLREIA